jgi:signal peptidase II
MSDEDRIDPAEPATDSKRERRDDEAPASAAVVAATAPPWRASYVFLGVVSMVTLALDLGSKAWAKSTLDDPKALTPKRVEVIADHLSMVFARNKGGAWGLLQDESEAIRRPFFLLISVAAVIFIVSLYRKLMPGQTALKWGLPLVLGGALGNLVDRIRYGYVVDFIDVRADFIRFINSIIVGERASDHWPTFNVADIAICVGVGLMAVDMFTSRKKAPAAGKPLDSDRPPPSDVDAGDAKAATRDDKEPTAAKRSKARDDLPPAEDSEPAPPPRGAA